MCLRNLAFYKALFLAWGFIVLVNAGSMRHKTFTIDEERNLGYGEMILNGDSNRISDSEMPFSALNAIPLWVKKFSNPGTRFQDVISISRFMTVLFSLLVAFYVFHWSRQLYGLAGAQFSLLLYALCPNIIAHAQLITTDLYALGMTTIATYHFWRWRKLGGRRAAGASAVALGLSQPAKYTCLFLYALYPCIVLLQHIRSSWGQHNLFDIPHQWKSLRASVVKITFFALLGLLIINAGFLFNRSLTPWGEYRFQSDIGAWLQSQGGWLQGWSPLLPYPFLEGLDLVRFNERTGPSFGNLYLLGQVQTREENFYGFKGYFLYAFLWKVPLAIQAFILLAAVFYVRNYKRHNFWENEIFLLLPIAFFTVYFNFFYRAQIGIRHFLVIFPLLFIFCGSLVQNWAEMPVRLKRLIIALTVYLGISVASYFPHYLSYFNEIVRDRKQAYKYLADSNIDWGQNDWYLERYLKKNPLVIYEPEFPQAGRIVVRVNALVGVWEVQKFRWLREHFEPVDHVAYSYLVYDVSPEDLQKME